MSTESVHSARVYWLTGASLVLAAGAGLLLYQLLPLLKKPENNGQPVHVEPPKPREKVPMPHVPFTDMNAGGAAGIDFHHFNGAFGQKLLPETMGSGVAIIDFDRDGKPDLLFVNSCPWPGHEQSRQKPPTLKLYHNRGGNKFEDVTEAAHLAVSMYGMGATVGDYDNDGWPDLFITGVGGNRLFRNVNGKYFEDVTAEAKVGGPGGWEASRGDSFLKYKKPLCWSTSASFLDYDGDGKLDLFVCNYVVWSPAADMNLLATLTGKDRAYGPPKQFDGSHCFLYRNVDGHSFEDVTTEAGIKIMQTKGVDETANLIGVGKSLGVIVCDIDEDGWPDIVVANDTVRNFLFHNVPGPKGMRRFEEMGVPWGVAYPAGSGEAQGAMGIDWARSYFEDHSALLIGNFSSEADTFLKLMTATRGSRRRPSFTDVAREKGIAGPSREWLKFGVVFLDFDLDGRLDFLTCNGHLEPDITKVDSGQRYEQPPQLFWNAGRSGFQPVTEQEVGSDLFQPIVGRGCAYADLDGDGKPDVILTANGGKPRLLRNAGKTGHHWLRLRLEGDGKHSNRSAIGARIKLEAGGQVQYRDVAAARGYLSQSELVATFGLGETKKVDRVTIEWPGRDPGPPTVLKDVAVDQEIPVQQKRRD